VAAHPAAVAVVAMIALFGALGATASADTVRVFAVGHRLRISDVVTYQSYRDKMFAMFDTAFPGRSGLVQAGVDDVASHIQPADPLAPAFVLVNFPEDAGLAAAFIGTRGAGARTSVASTQAFLSLFSTYAQQRSFYRQLYELDAGNIVPLIVMSVTDTVYRAFYETFRDIAVTYGVYVTAGANLPPARVVHQLDDPALYNTLIDPDEAGTRDYVYFATSPVVVNTTFLFQPDGQIFIQNDDGTVTSAPGGTGGEIRGSQDKVYLTPIELTLLKLFDGPIDGLRVLDTPLGRLGIVISKDAWMIDVNDRLAARHAHLLIQSEAFSSWAFQDEPWDPDIFKQGGFNNLQKHPSFLYNVAPSMTGNLLDITFDGQSSILGRKQKVDPGALSTDNAWVGQNPDTGFLAIAPWIRDDPGIADAGLSLADRRAALAADGVALRPGSGIACPDPLTPGACENGYREAVVFADVEMPLGIDVLKTPDATAPVATAYGTSTVVNDDDDAAPASQLHPQIAADGDTVYAVWQDTRHGNDNVYGAVSTDAGVTWSADVKVSDDAPGAAVELLPEIAFHRDERRSVETVYVVWQRLGAGGNQRDAEIRLARFDATLAKLGPDLRVDDVDSAGKWHPVVVPIGRRGDPLVVFVDERVSGPGVSRFERLRAARGSGKRGPDGRPRVEFRRATRDVVRRKDVDPLARQLDNEWAPAIVAGDRRVHAAWLDFRSYNWDVYASSGNRAGLRYRRDAVRVDDSPNFERLNSHPSLAYSDAADRLILVWSDQRDREADTNVFYATSVDDGRTWSAPARLDDGDVGLDRDTDVPANAWQPEAAASGARVCVAWQDDREGNNDVFAALSTDGGATFAADERVDDSGDGPSEQFSPSVAVAGGRCLIAWSDDRSGDFDVHIASRTF
jgi:predicted amidohydrolase